MLAGLVLFVFRGVMEPATGFRGPLLGVHLDELGAPAPETVEGSVDVADVIERMHRDGIDCLLVTEDGRLAGIFTERDALYREIRREGARAAEVTA